jgi:hypothetical protein
LQLEPSTQLDEQSVEIPIVVYETEDITVGAQDERRVRLEDPVRIGDSSGLSRSDNARSDNLQGDLS